MAKSLRNFTVLAMCLVAWVAAGQELLRMDTAGIPSDQLDALLALSGGTGTVSRLQNGNAVFSLEKKVGERKLVVVNPSTRANVVFDCPAHSERGKLRMTRLLMAELRNLGLGDADTYTCIVAERTDNEYVPVERAEGKVPKTCALPRFRYGTRGNLHLASSAERTLKSVHLDVPTPIFADNVSADDRARIRDAFKKEALDRGIYRYEYALPNGDSTTYSCEDVAEDEGVVCNATTPVGDFRMVDWNDSSTSPATTAQLAPVKAGAQVWDALLSISQPVYVKVGFSSLASGVLGASYMPITYHEKWDSISRRADRPDYGRGYASVPGLRHQDPLQQQFRFLFRDRWQMSLDQT